MPLVGPRGISRAMSDADLSTPTSGKIGVAIVVVLLHVAVVLALVRAFAPDFTAQVTRTVVSAFTVEVSTPPPSPEPPAKQPAPEAAGAEGAAGKKAKPKEAAAPKPKLVVAERQAPPVAGKGDANAAGARDAGAGTGAGEKGAGLGAGGSGEGTGGGARKLEKIAGEINSSRDFPRKTRALREGQSVTVQMTVGADGRASNCRVIAASADPEADAIVCRLAEQRFRFRPKLDSAGNPVVAQYQWRQRWWDPRD